MNCKEEKNHNFMVKKHGSHYVNSAKITSPILRQVSIVSWCDAPRKVHFHLGNANTYKPNHKETEKSKLREIPEPNGLYS